MTELLMPEAKTYLAGLAAWPYRASLQTVLGKLEQQAPSHGRVIDLMCGPGYLLHELAKRRQDLNLLGVDNDPRHVKEAQRLCGTDARFLVADVREYLPAEPVDVVACTGAVHHLPYEDQPAFLARMARMLRKDGFAVISDCYVDPYGNEIGRKLAAAKLGYEYLVATIKNGGTGDVIPATIEILSNDVLGLEFKTSYVDRIGVLYGAFERVQTLKVWPESPGGEAASFGGYGDYIHICRGPKH